MTTTSLWVVRGFLPQPAQGLLWFVMGSLTHCQFLLGKHLTFSKLISQNYNGKRSKNSFVSGRDCTCFASYLINIANKNNNFCTLQEELLQQWPTQLWFQKLIQQQPKLTDTCVFFLKQQRHCCSQLWLLLLRNKMQPAMSIRQKLTMKFLVKRWITNNSSAWFSCLISLYWFYSCYFWKAGQQNFHFWTGGLCQNIGMQYLWSPQPTWFNTLRNYMIISIPMAHQPGMASQFKTFITRKYHFITTFHWAKFWCSGSIGHKTHIGAKRRHWNWEYRLAWNWSMFAECYTWNMAVQNGKFCLYFCTAEVVTIAHPVHRRSHHCLGNNHDRYRWHCLPQRSWWIKH